MTEQQKLIEPTVAFEGMNDAGYSINVDTKRLRNLYTTAGLSEKDIEDGRVVLAREMSPQLDRMLVKNDVLVLTENTVLASKKDFLSASKRILTGRPERSHSRFKTLMSPKRFEKYLKRAPEDRAYAFSEKLFEKSMQRRLNENLAHNIQHIKDQSDQEISRMVPKAYRLQKPIGYLTVIATSITYSSLFGLHNLRDFVFDIVAMTIASSLAESKFKQFIRNRTESNLEKRAIAFSKSSLRSLDGPVLTVTTEKAE